MLIKVLKVTCIIVLIVIIIWFIVGIINSNKSLNTSGNNIDTTEEHAKEYTNFGENIDFCKNTFDSWWNMMISKGNFTRTKSTDWYTVKHQVYPYSNIDIKQFYIYPNQEFAAISIAYDDYGNVINLKFTGIPSDVLDRRYDVTAELEYTYIMLSIAQILKFSTKDEQLCEYLQEKIIDCFNNGHFYINEKKQGFKFGLGASSDNYLNLEVCLSKYAQN